MLASLLFGSYRQRILGLLLLHPDEDFHVREIARLTGTSAGTVHKELARLADAGVLARSRLGNQVRYAANRACPIFEELAGIMRKTAGLSDVLRDALAIFQERIVVALVFGSVARGEERAGSDVDVLVVGDLGFAEAVEALYSAQASLGREINPVVMTAAELHGKLAAGDPFLKEILTREKMFLIGDEHDLGELAGHPSPGPA